MVTCFLCNGDVPPKSRVYFKNMSEEPMESVREILAEKYSNEQVVEALGREPVACRGKCNTILNKLTKLKTDLRKIKEEVEEKVHSVVSARLLSSSITPTNSPPRQSRGRLEFDTPTRDVINHTVAGNSPIVSVG